MPDTARILRLLYVNDVTRSPKPFPCAMDPSSHQPIGLIGFELHKTAPVLSPQEFSLRKAPSLWNNKNVSDNDEFGRSYQKRILCSEEMLQKG